MGLSEKDIEKEYRNIKMMDCPPLWDDIEKNLAPKKSAAQEQERLSASGKKGIPIRRYASLAAVILVLLMLIPVVKMAGSGAEKSADSAKEESGRSQNDKDAAENCVQEGSCSGEQEEAPRDAEDQIQLSIQIEKAEKLAEEENSWVITASVLTEGNSSYLPGDEITVCYEGTDYDKKDFSGELEILAEKSEENLKLLKILP